MTTLETPAQSFAETWQRLQPRLRELEDVLARLLKSPALRFDEGIRSALPEGQGIYRIFDAASPAETIRAGRTKTAAGGLRQRVYQNHLMGDQRGNLRAQPVGDGTRPDLETAKKLIGDSFAVHVLIVENDVERTMIEHLMLAELQPRYCN